MKRTDKSLLYKVSVRLTDLINRIKPASLKVEENRIYTELYVGEDIEKCRREDQIQQMKYCLLTVTVSIILIVAVLLVKKPVGNLLSDGKIRRPDTAAEKQDVVLQWSGESEEGPVSGKISLTVREQMPETNALQSILDYAEEYINGLYPYGKPVYGALEFIETVPGTVVEIVWEPTEYKWISYDGMPTSGQRPEEGVLQEIRVTLKAYDSEKTISIFPLLMNAVEEETGFENRLREYLLSAEADISKPWVELPDEFDGVRLNWQIPRDRTAIIIFLLMFIALFLVIFSGHEKKKKRLKKRETEMLNDYPELISKLLLLLEAGLTMRRAWERVVNNYRNSGQKHYVYEEMCITLREIENGYSEVAAFERFGKRCRLLPYLRFSGLLEQNLVKGSRSVLPMLEQEALNAFEERKENAKRIGEEAGTKLLIPMTGMLVIVLVMIMFPAFQNI